MKIAVVASPVTPLRPAQLGGAQAFVSDLAAGLAARGHAVTLHCAAGSVVPGVRIVTVPIPEDAEVALVMPGGEEPPPAPGVEAALRAMFDAIPQDVEAISQHAFDAPAFALGRGRPTLHTLHLPPIVAGVLAAARDVPRAQLAAVSLASARSWTAAGVDVGGILFNGIPDQAVEGTAVERVALVAGRISPEKGIEHAVTAARAAGLPVRMAGAHYDPGYAPDLSGVEVLGSLSRAELRRVMARSALTICAVRWDEPFGMVAAEAQMAGCPVAAYRRGAMPEVVEDGVSGVLVEPDDVEALARAIAGCLELDRKRVRESALRRLGMNQALDRYELALQRCAQR